MANLNINGRAISVDVEDDTPLLWAIRENVGLTGTKYGCGIAQCGACTVHIDGVATRSCGVTVGDAAGKQITTIEGLAAADGTLHPMQAAFKENHGLQCGFCTPGMVMSAVDLVQNHGVKDEAQVRQALEGNICRCTGYHNIVKAVIQGGAAMKAAA
mgnify:CR=1 FL=1